MTEQLKIEKRQLGRNGPQVSVIGFGAWQLSGPFTVGGRESGLPDFRPDYFLELLENGIDKGINFFETSNVYGKSEELLGKLSRRYRPEMIIASKCGIDPSGRIDVSAKFTRDSVLDSLHRLQTDYIDIYQITLPDLKSYDPRAGLDELRELQHRGVVGRVGLSLREPKDCLKALNEDLTDTLQLTYNMFDTRQNDHVIPLAKKRGVGIIVKSPLNKGVLTGKYNADTVFPSNDSRSTYLLPERLAGRDSWLEAFCEEFGLARKELIETALSFILANKAVSTIALGMRSRRQLNQNAAIASSSLMNAKTISRIESFSRREWRLIGEGLCNDLIR